MLLWRKVVDNKTKKIILMAFIIFTTIFIVYMFYEFKNATNLEVRSGTYYSQLNILDEGNTKIVNWEARVSKDNAKKGTAKNEFNIEPFEKFRDAIINIKSTKSKLFLILLYSIFLIVVTFVILPKDAQLFKEKNNKKAFQGSISLIIIYLVFRTSIYFIELNRLHKDIVYYFALIK